jgi:hypothetical protein
MPLQAILTAFQELACYQIIKPTNDDRKPKLFRLRKSPFENSHYCLAINIFSISKKFYICKTLLMELG